MIDVKMNKKSDKKYANELWRCDFCQSIDSQAHIVWCPAFAPLREGKNLHDDEDLVDYFENVTKIETKLNEHKGPLKDCRVRGPLLLVCLCLSRVTLLFLCLLLLYK